MKSRKLIPNSLTTCLLLLLIVTVGCGGSSSSSRSDNALPPQGDLDGDGLSNEREETLGTDARTPDTDSDGIWDGEEITMYGTDPLEEDSDNDGINDGADPQPMTINPMPRDPNSGLFVEHGIFKNNALGTARERISSTRFQENHVVYAPQGAPESPFLLYQTYIADTNSDTLFNEADLAGSAIAIRNSDGSRPRLLTDLDSTTGMISDNGAIDATPEPSPDGNYIIFVSDRDNPGSFNLKLYVMEIDGSNPEPISYSSNAPDDTIGEIDADPHWGPDNRVTFKRQVLGANPEFSRVFTATIDTDTMTLSDVVERTDGPDTILSTPNGPGDFDPKISPDGQYITSYRHVSDAVSFFGDYDLWIGPYSDPSQPADASIIFVDEDNTVASLFPRWNAAGTKVAVWQLDDVAIDNNLDAIDIVVYDLTIQPLPFNVSATKSNITLGDGWFETMPSWNPDPAKADELVYSASRQF